MFHVLRCLNFFRSAPVVQGEGPTGGLMGVVLPAIAIVFCLTFDVRVAYSRLGTRLITPTAERGSREVHRASQGKGTGEETNGGVVCSVVCRNRYN